MFAQKLTCTHHAQPSANCAKRWCVFQSVSPGRRFRPFWSILELKPVPNRKPQSLEMSKRKNFSTEPSARRDLMLFFGSSASRFVVLFGSFRLFLSLLGFSVFYVRGNRKQNKKKKTGTPKIEVTSAHRIAAGSRKINTSNGKESAAHWIMSNC